jgi:hypothetical protein
MKFALIRSLATFLMLIAACTPDAPPPSDSLISAQSNYVSLDEGLTQFKDDFNAMAEKLRLVFISGPSCGICLRGMDDLNQSIVSTVQNDPRIHTLVLYVPALGANEEHAKAVVSLLPGPRVSHYWDGSGNSGLEFQETLDIPMYAWDIWMIYEPGAQWEEASVPPHPAFWQHQLPSLPKDQKLDAEEFAAAVIERLSALPPATKSAEFAAASEGEAGLLKVAQPTSFILRQHHRSRGGYRKLKTIASIRYEGETQVGDQTYALTTDTSRPHNYQRTTASDRASGTVSWDGAKVEADGAVMGLPREFTDELLASYDFDGWMTEWKDKGNKLRRLGMQKLGDRLPWIIEAELANGRTWHIYIDSHTGDVFRQALIDADGQESLVVEFDAFDDVQGYRLPAEVRYYRGETLLATDRFNSFAITASEPASTD